MARAGPTCGAYAGVAAFGPGRQTNAVAESMATRLQVDKSELLDRDAESMAVRLALAETHIAVAMKLEHNQGLKITICFKNSNEKLSQEVHKALQMPFRER